MGSRKVTPRGGPKGKNTRRTRKLRGGKPERAKPGTRRRPKGSRTFENLERSLLEKNNQTPEVPGVPGVANAATPAVPVSSLAANSPAAAEPATPAENLAQQEAAAAEIAKAEKEKEEAEKRLLEAKVTLENMNAILDILSKKLEQFEFSPVIIPRKLSRVSEGGRRTMRKRRLH